MLAYTCLVCVAVCAGPPLLLRGCFVLLAMVVKFPVSLPAAAAAG
jgi:hypothetical protein